MVSVLSSDGQIEFFTLLMDKHALLKKLVRIEKR